MMLKAASSSTFLQVRCTGWEWLTWLMGLEMPSQLLSGYLPWRVFCSTREVTPPVLASEVAPKLLTDLTIVMPVNTSRLLRYQAGRFTKIVSNSTSETRFQISADSLTNAEKNGLKVEQLLQLLEKNLKTQLPASYKKLAERWDQRRIEVKIEKAMLLRVEDPLILKILIGKSSHVPLDQGSL